MELMTNGHRDVITEEQLAPVPHKREGELSRTLHLARLFPNMVTILGLCAGLSSMRLSLNDKWEWAVTFIIIAAFIDAVDGRLARMLGSTSRFGAQLDSLADFLNFGVAPGFALYLWATHEVKGFGWALVLFFAICCAIRLARFNTELEEKETTQFTEKFFVGVPAPAAALAVLAPMVFSFAFKESYPEFFSYISFVSNPWFICFYSAFIGILMVSRIPTFSFKKIIIKKEFASFVLVSTGLFAIALLAEPWITFSVMGILYFLSIPVSAVSYYRPWEGLIKPSNDYNSD